MKKSWTQITTELNEAKFKLPKDQSEVKKEVQKVDGRTLDIRFGEDKRGKIHVYIDGMLMGDPYKNMKLAQKDMKNIKKVIMQMGEENISAEEILGVINETNI